MGQCNYCTFQQIKKSKPKGYKVRILDGDFGLGGVDIFVVPPHITISDIRKWKKSSEQLPNGDKKRQKYFVAWFMELPDHCCC